MAVFHKRGSLSNFSELLPEEYGTPTNQKAEIYAAIRAVQTARNLFKAESSFISVEIKLDSEYVRKGITSWIKGWKANGWHVANGKAVLNQDLWFKLDDAIEECKQDKIEIVWHHVAGHAKCKGNIEVDKMAHGLASRIMEQKKKKCCCSIVSK